MGYRLGVDLGTTFTSAAVRSAGWPSMVGLGNRSLQVPSVVFLAADGEVLVGEAAERRGLVEPDRLVREFKRRFGDQIPVLVGGSPYSAPALTARLLAWVVATVTERQGQAPDRVVVTHPANWGPYKRDLLGQAVRLADIEGAGILTEPEAAAVLYASRNTLTDGQCVAVYDLGGGTFDAAVLRKQAVGFELLGTPEGIEQLGGMDFDQAVFSHVVTDVRESLAALDLDKPEVRVAMARLRRDCVEAKEALTSDTETVVPIVLPGINTSVRLTRSELEAMIRPAVAETVGAMRRALRSATVDPSDLTAIVLVGGSSRIPLVAQLLSSEFSRPLALDTHPKHDVALGAALADDAVVRPAEPHDRTADRPSPQRSSRVPLPPVRAPSPRIPARTNETGRRSVRAPPPAPAASAAALSRRRRRRQRLSRAPRPRDGLGHAARSTARSVTSTGRHRSRRRVLMGGGR